jgi:hypothetical protein
MRIMINRVVVLTGVLAFSHWNWSGEESVNGRKSIVLESERARLVVDLAGGAISEFRLKDNEINPLNWGTPQSGDTSARARGHFLCLDRWGPPSEAEGARGMPYHGEAANVQWTVDNAGTKGRFAIEARLSARLPKAGLSVRRTIQLSTSEAVMSVKEEVTNENALGRIFNMVQHPTIAPPFLDENTIVDCNGVKGFAQGGKLPTPEQPSAEWPNALKKSGQQIDLRYLTNDPEPNVVSFAIEQKHGWVTAVNPRKRLLIGYLWQTTDYPWVSLWRDVRDGKPGARGLEFGTTGLHQPYPILVKKGQIWERPLFEYIDAGETISKTYVAFLKALPEDSIELESLDVTNEGIYLRIKAAANTSRRLLINLVGIMDE